MEEEIELTRKLFDLEEILLFQEEHDAQIIREDDFQYYCFIDGKSYASGLTPIGALVFGIKTFNKIPA